MNSVSKTPPPPADEDVRVLHRITPLKDWQAPADAGAPYMKIAVIDLETTGLDPLYDEIIEIAVGTIVIDKAGRVIAVESMRTGLQQPSRPIEPHIAKITGIDDAIVAGKCIDSTAIAARFEEVDACLSFNAAFDRRHLEMSVPEVAEMPWICAMADVPWADLGFDGRAQGFLLAQAGMFNPVAHRARDDVTSLINLLAHECRDGRPVMGHALEHAQAASWRFEATNLPYRFRKDIKRRGYAWADKHRLRHTLVRPADYDAELAWYRDLVGDEPSIVPVDWIERYRADWTWKPVKRKIETVSWRR
ncbi:MAG: 3'-5' exonuclease [Sphingomonadaceae bacterium]